MIVRIKTRLAVKRIEHQAKSVEGGHEHARRHRKPSEAGAGSPGQVHRLDDRVLGKEPREAGNARARDRADQDRAVGPGHELPQSAHPAHVLLMVQGDDGRTRAQEKQGFEERVGHEVEDRRGIRRGAERHGHVAELGQRGIRDHALDVVLDKRDQGHEKGGDPADHEHERERGLRKLEKRRHPRHHEDARRHHGCGVDQGRNRRGTLHRVGQPHVEGKLRRLSHRADEKPDTDRREEQPRRPEDDLDRGSSHRRGSGENRCVVERAEIREHQRYGEQEAEIADPVYEERLQARVDRARSRIPEADEKIRHQAHRLPTEEKLQEIVRHHQHQHREGEEGDVGEETPVSRVVGHVSDGVDVHHQRHEGHHHHHQGGQAVDQEADLEPDSVRHEPGIDRTVEHGAIQHVEENQAGGGEGNRHPDDRDPMRPRAPDSPASQAGDERTGKRSERHEQVELQVRHVTLSGCRGRRR